MSNRETPAQKHEYYWKKRDYFLAKCKERRKKKIEEIRSYNRSWGQLNKEKKRNWVKKNIEKVHEYHKKYLRNFRRLALEKYGNECECCKERQLEFLAFDHINGEGKKDRSRCSLTFYRKLVKEEKKKNIRILCHNCNSSIAYYGYCPHKK